MALSKTGFICHNTFRKWQLVGFNSFYQNTQKPTLFYKKFCTSPVRSLRNRLQSTKPKVDPLEPQFNGIVVESNNLEASRLWKPLAFTIGFSSVSICAAAIWEFENVHKRRKQFKEWFYEKRKFAGRWRHDVNKWWNGISDSEKMFIPICFLNIMVFFAWKVPVLQPVMVKYFCSNPAAKAICWPMILSAFSHYSTLHIFANMYVLHSFSSGCVTNMGKEQFIGFYMAAGTVASLASYVRKVLANKPGLSLGASGAIMAMLAYCCTKFPDLQLSIIFLPIFTFKASAAIKCIMAFDAAGILLGWKFFDHAAHLGGALFGIFWSAYGTAYIWNKRGPIVEAWGKIREPFTKD